VPGVHSKSMGTLWKKLFTNTIWKRCCRYCIFKMVLRNFVILLIMFLLS